MGELKNSNLIIAKGLLFLFLGCFASALLLFLAPQLDIALLLTIAIWSFCRFYYFAFYVIEHYVDPEFKFSGLYSFSLYLLRSKQKVQAETEEQNTSSS